MICKYKSKYKKEKYEDVEYEYEEYIQPLTYEELEIFVKSDNVFTMQIHHDDLLVKSKHKIINRFVNIMRYYYKLNKPEKADAILKLFNKYVKIKTVRRDSLSYKNAKKYPEYLYFHIVDYSGLLTGLGKVISDLEKDMQKNLGNYKDLIDNSMKMSEKARELIREEYDMDIKNTDKQIQKYLKEIELLTQHKKEVLYKKSLLENPDNAEKEVAEKEILLKNF